jgi:hypothetical protein
LRLGTLTNTVIGWYETLKSRMPPGFPKLYVRSLVRAYPATLLREAESDVHYAEATENLLNDRELDAKWWEPLRRGAKPLSTPPIKAYANFNGRSCSIDVHFPVNPAPEGVPSHVHS